MTQAQTPEQQQQDLSTRVHKAINKVCKWRTVFVGWQLGTRAKEDPEAQAVKDSAEKHIMHRIELSALAALMIKKGLITVEEFNEQLIIEAEAYDQALQKKFPGFKSTDTGMDVNVALARDTMQGWRP
jgi:hypothetical protein